MNLPYKFSAFLFLLLAALILTAAAAPQPAPATPPATSTAPAPAATKAPNDTTPTLITLHCTDADPNSVLRDFFAQTGFAFETHFDPRAKLPRLTIDADRQPYWQVACTISDALNTNMHLRRNGKVAVNSAPPYRDPETGARCISGPFLLIAHAVHNNADFTGPDHAADCAVDIILQVEPHLHLATFDTRCQPDLAVDELGNSLLYNPAPPPAPRIPAPETYMQTQIVLNPPAKAGHRITQLKGSLHCTVIDQTKLLNIPADRFDDTTTADLQGAQITVRPMVVSQGNFNVSVRITAGKQDPEQWSYTEELLNAGTIMLLDEHDMPLFTGGTTHGKGKLDHSLTAVFTQTQFQEKLGPPVKCRITIPLSMRDIAVPYEFKNLPLP